MLGRGHIVVAAMLTVVASAEVWCWTSPMQRSSLNLVDRDRRLGRHGCVGVLDTVAATVGAALTT